MILVTVGSGPLDFSRMLETLDQLGSELGEEMVMQVGFCKYRPRYAKWFDFAPYEKMLDYFGRALVVVSHASAGPLLHAKHFGKPVVLFPRSGDQREIVDNHQIEFARALLKEGEGWIEVVNNISELPLAVRQALAKKEQVIIRNRQKDVSALVNYLRSHIKNWETSSGQSGKPLATPGFFRRLKQMIFKLGLYQFLSDLKNNTHRLLRRGYQPIKFWNGWSRTFFNQRFRHSIGKSHEWLLGQIRRQAAHRILEVGCCFGRNLRFLQSQLGENSTLIGVDFSLEMLGYARSYLGEFFRQRLICGDIKRLPFADRSFDFVFTYGTLMHLPEVSVRDALGELGRVSKGYVCLLEETNWESEFRPGEILHPNPYTFLYDYQTILKEKGWPILETKFLEEGAALLICIICQTQEVSQPFIFH